MNNLWKNKEVIVQGYEGDKCTALFTFQGTNEEIPQFEFSCSCLNSVFTYPILKVNVRLPKKQPDLDATVFQVERYVYATYPNKQVDELKIICNVETN